MAPPLTEVDVQFWLPQLIWHRLMFILVLGPGDTEVELQNFPGDGSEREEVDSESTVPFQLKLGAGSLLILRPDLLGHLVTGDAGNFVLSWWFSPVHRVAPTRGAPVPRLTPAAKLLDQWALDRMREMARVQSRLREHMEEWRVVVPYAYKIDSPRHLTRGGQRLEVAPKGEVLAGSVEVVDGLRWLKTLTNVLDQDGHAKFGYVLIDGELTGVGQFIEKVPDLPREWQVAFDRLWTCGGSQVAVRSAACKFLGCS